MLDIILENFQFLVVEVDNQIRSARKLISEFDFELIDKLEARDDYIDNLKTVVENKCFSRIHAAEEALAEEEVNAIRAAHVMSVNLEKIADFCVNIARQTDFLSHYAFLHRYPMEEMFAVILEAMPKISIAFRKRKMELALEICNAEYQLDQMYKATFDRIMADLQEGREAGNHVTAIFIVRYLERIGDSLLNIGEALLFAITGDRIKIRQFEALRSSLAKSGIQVAPEDIQFTSIWGSRSGCRISRVNNANLPHMQVPILFKEGAIQKVRREKLNIERWEKRFPEVTPEIIGYDEKKDKAAMLLEFMDGNTLEEIVLNAPPDTVDKAFSALAAVLDRTWPQSTRERPYQSDYMAQLEARLGGVLRIHPEFQRQQLQIGRVTVPSFRDLVKVCGRIESRIRAPFMVLLHGDFNLNNILFDATADQIKFIDFYRSDFADYVQDASVFLVSHFRLPVRNGTVRDRLNANVERFYRFFSSFGDVRQDDTFQLRMAMALARSFFTSTRFEMNRGFARDMYLRAVYLMETISQHEGRPWESYALPEAVLYY
ncbi:MAG: PhoU domain-containing protein [Desulfosarcinaceae bacterium]|nr:PhoU domain-containing protein [Desulfosarcinaceae bacterium]